MPPDPHLPITFSDERISAHGGLEVFGRFLQAIDLRDRVRVASGSGGGENGALGGFAPEPPLMNELRRRQESHGFLSAQLSTEAG
jgi:hypothetical protein